MGKFSRTGIIIIQLYRVRIILSHDPHCIRDNVLIRQRYINKIFCMFDLIFFLYNLCKCSPDMNEIPQRNELLQLDRHLSFSIHCHDWHLLCSIPLAHAARNLLHRTSL